MPVILGPLGEGLGIGVFSLGAEQPGLLPIPGYALAAQVTEVGAERRGPSGMPDDARLDDDVARSAGEQAVRLHSRALPAVLGGIGTLWGPLLGAAILIPLTELTRSYMGGSGRGIDLIVYGGLIIAISLARPQGLVGLFSPKRKEAAR